MRFIWLSLVVTCLAAPVAADTMSYFDDDVSNAKGFAKLLKEAGFDPSDKSIESFAQSYTVPGTSGMTSLTFNYFSDGSSKKFDFGFFDLSKISADPLSRPRDWAMEALASATLVFNDQIASPGASATFDVLAGTQLGFFLLPNARLSDVQKDPDKYISPPGKSENYERAPLFSVANANPGAYDQMLAFQQNDDTFFSWEDVTRTKKSDRDFDDLAFTVTALPANPSSAVALQSVPEPSSIVLYGLGLSGMLALRRRTRSRYRRRPD